MKLLRFSTKKNHDLLGIVLDQSQILEINASLEFFSIDIAESISSMKKLLCCPAILKALNSIHEKTLSLQKNNAEAFIKLQKKALFSIEDITFLPPLENPQKIICLGRNYSEHAKEGGKEPPKNPMIWGKFNSALLGHKQNIVLPSISNKVDVEVELVVVIGKKGKHIPEKKAMEYVAGYTIGNDVSARDYQYMDKQYTRAKTMDTFAPVGPWIVTTDELTSPHNLDIELSVNDNIWQQSNTSHMIFSIPYIISYLSKSFTFNPGDLIFTGTPSGVGHYQNPPIYLQKGDLVKLTIENIGTLQNGVVEE
ncbi:MAG: fumarylacetoacetate hydrolase family protein [Asgard group archaeon]|nr:fumarylacetoacetate hydrolase family protein [Asgard group archaeon]